MMEVGTLREFTFGTVMLRLACATLFGGIIGLERGRKRRPAGMRTYMIVCVGSTLTMLLGQYNSLLFESPQWESTLADFAITADISRIGAQVINGIGFLGAGTIVVTDHQEVKGLTTAAALWASACTGLAIGAGFYECVILALLFIILCIGLLPVVEDRLVSHARNMNLYVEMESVESIGCLVQSLKNGGAKIIDIDFSSGRSQVWKRPNAVIIMRLPPQKARDSILVQLAQMDCVRYVEEI